MKIFITGAGGFVGSHLIRLLSLSPDNEIYALALNEEGVSSINLPKKNIYVADLLDNTCICKIVDDIRPNFIYHLAGQSSVGSSWGMPAKTYEANIIGTLNILESLRLSYLNNTRVLLIGSSEQYGDITEEHLPLKESFLPRPSNPYAISKYAQELTAQMYAESYDMSIVMTRSFNHIGPGQSPSFVISDWAKQIVEIEKNIKEPQIQTGTLDVKRDFLDVRDVVIAYSTLIEKGEPGEIYNVCSGKSVSIKDLLYQLIELSHCKDQINVITTESKLRKNDCSHILGDYTKLNATTGWSPSYNLKRTLEDVLQYWREKI